MVIGIDEVGRGCWAGPLVAVAVLIDNNSKLIDLKLNDSKKLNKKQRDIFAEQIPKVAQVGIGWVDARSVDKIGLTEANRRAMLIAIKQLDYMLVDKIIIDGKINYLKGHLCKDEPCKELCKDDSDRICEQCDKIEVMIGADGKIAAVSAASIIAKVARDNFMAKQALIYPGYGFEKHVGYGTKYHSDQLAKLGVTDIHRKSYKPVKRLIETNI